MILPIDTNIFPQKTGVYIVGGSIRDLLCGRIPLDYDIVVKGDTASFARGLAARISGRVVELGKPGQAVRRVIAKDTIFDITPVNGESIREDLRLRDFTINAMALSVSSGSLIDQLGSRRDLAAKKIRMVSSDIFRKDPVRLIRAYRLAASFNFSIEAKTRSALARDVNFIRKSAGERIRDEFFKIFNCAESHIYVARMAHCKLLFSVFPELLTLNNFRLSDVFPHNIFEQTLYSLESLEKLLKNEDQKIRVPGERFYHDIDADRATLLKWAILFHDIGKPGTQTSTTGGKVHIYGHAIKAAIMTRNICRRLKFSNRQTDFIEFLVANHLWPIVLFRAHKKKIPMQKAFTRVFMECRDLTPDVLLHALAVFIGNRNARDLAGRQEFTDYIRSLLRYYHSVLQPRASLPPPLNGNDLIKEFGLKPSVEFRRILKHIEEEQLTNEKLTREQALELVKNLLKRQNLKSQSHKGPGV